MGITALIATVAYSSLSSAISAAESMRSASERMHELNRAVAIISRDIRQIVNRPVVDEFGQLSPSLTGGELARAPLVMTRAGWHNTVGAPRSTLQRLEWRLDGDALVRAYFPVLDRTAGTEPVETIVLEGVDRFDVRFLPALSLLQSDRDDRIDQRNWRDNWVPDGSIGEADFMPPAAIEVIFELRGIGEIRRLYALPST